MSIHINDLKDKVLDYYASVPLDDLKKDLDKFVSNLDFFIYHIEMSIDEIEYESLLDMDSYDSSFAVAS